jgi:hypothetical protein
MRDFDEYGEDEAGRKLVAARVACEGRFDIVETAGGYLAVPAGTESVSSATIDALMTKLGIDFAAAPVQET